MSLRRLPPGHLAFALLLAGLLVAHVIAVFTENINWDEFALLSRAADTLRTGQLSAGGRPGLGALILIPFVDGCSDSIAAIRSARLLWVGFTVALVWGFWTLLARGLETEERSARAAALGVALLVLVPAFLRFSIQVRTDQPAIALGLWGGVALLASRRRSSWALLAGILFGIGYLFSQKVVYVAALAGLLVVGDLFLRRELRVERELARAGLCLLSGTAILELYRAILPAFVEPVAVQSVSAGLGAFGFYRADFGYAFYVRMLPTLIPQLILMALLLNATGKMLRNEDGQRRLLLLAWAILALGIVVGLFHAGAFPYFWMTLGQSRPPRRPRLHLGFSGRTVDDHSSRASQGFPARTTREPGVHRAQLHERPRGIPPGARPLLPGYRESPPRHVWSDDWSPLLGPR